MLFQHLLIWSCDLSQFYVVYLLRLLICKYCTILAYLGWIPLDHTCMIFLMDCWIQIANIWLRILASMPIVYFLCCLFTWFWSYDNTGLVKRVWESFFFWIFWNSLRKIGVSSSLNVWYNLPVKIWSRAQVLNFDEFLIILFLQHINTVLFFEKVYDPGRTGRITRKKEMYFK